MAVLRIDVALRIKLDVAERERERVCVCLCVRKTALHPACRLNTKRCPAVVRIDVARKRPGFVVNPDPYRCGAKQLKGFPLWYLKARHRFWSSCLVLSCICRLRSTADPKPCINVTFRVAVLEREFFIDNLLVRIHLIIELIMVDRPCAMGV